MGGPGGRDELRATFDSVAPFYHQVRPAYPDELFDELVRLAGLGPASLLLEIGCAAGTATIPLAGRGYSITCVELGAGLAETARRNLAAFPAVRVEHAAFESWEPPAGTAFDLVYAATSWHWIDPGVRYAKAARLLRPGGHLAIWGTEHAFPVGGDSFFAEIQDVYDEIGEGLPPGSKYLRPDELPDLRAEIERTGLFCDVEVRHFDWELRYDAEGYIRLLDTFSGHIAMAQWQRDRLYGEIRRRLTNRAEPVLRRHWGAVLNVARKR